MAHEYCQSPHCSCMDNCAVKLAVEEEREAVALLVEANEDFMMLQDFGMQSMCDQLKTNIAKQIRNRK